MKKTIFMALAAFILSTQITYAQYSVKGVVNGSDNEPIPGAVVSIPHTSTAVSTDSKGMFTLSAPTDFDSIMVSLIGYQSQELLAKDKSQQLSVLLKVSNTALSEVQILALKKGGSVTTLSHDELNRSSGLKLEDALNTVPGVMMSSRSPWGGQHIIIRGYYPSADNGRTNGENFNGLGYQLYIDNIPVTDATGTTVMDDIDMSNLGKVEVVKGPSPLYGSYIAGAVSLYTPTPTPDQTSVQEQAIAGSYGLFRTNTSLMTSDGSSSIWVNYGQQTYDGFRPNDHSKKNYASFAGDFKTSSKNTISTYFSYSHSYEQLTGEIDSATFYNRQAVSDTNYMFNQSHVDIESYRTGITDKYKLSKKFSTETTLFATGNELNQYFAHGFSLNNNLNFGGRTALVYDTKSDKISVNGITGVSFQKSNQTDQGNFILPFVPSPFTSTSGPDFPSDVKNYALSYNLFTNWIVGLPSNFTLAIGGSLNFNEFGTQNLLNSGKIYLDDPIFIKSFSPVFLPSISLTKALTSNIAVYANVSEGYAPALLSQMTNSVGKVDSALKPENAIQYEIGTKGSLGSTQKFTYQLALYDMDITNRLVQETANSISFYTNAGEERNLGAELYMAYNLLNNKNNAITLLRPWVSYTYSNYTYVNFKTFGAKGNTDTVTNDYSNKKVAEVAPNVFNFGIDLQTKIGFYANTTYQYVDKVPITFDNGHYMNAYSLLGAKIGYKHTFNHFVVDVYAGANNLLGSTYYSLIFVGQNIQELAQGNDPNIKNGGGDGYILPAPYAATFYGGLTISYKF
ncbi:MAG: TonB-dependent receptor [Bacteroidia bacterium]